MPTTGLAELGKAYAPRRGVVPLFAKRVRRTGVEQCHHIRNSRDAESWREDCGDPMYALSLGDSECFPAVVAGRLPGHEPCLATGLATVKPACQERTTN